MNRKERGQQIAQNDNQITRIDKNHYKVKSQSRNIQHEVISLESGWSCSCEDYYFKKTCCKHIHAVEISLHIRKEVKKHIIETVNTNDCQKCGSSNVGKWGIRHNKNYDLQVFKCKDCKTKYSTNLGFEGMHASPQIITSAMQLYFTGESLRGVQKFLKLQGINMSHVSIYKWVKKYTKIMDNYLSTITPQVGDKWHADEVWLKINGDKKYLFAMMDNETRFWIAQEVADRKEGHDASSLFRAGKKVTGIKPKVIITDGLKSYSEAYRKEFWTVKRENRTIHIENVHLQGNMNNNQMERLNGEFRDREKVCRGIKKKDSVIIDGYQLYHNYIRPHMSLDGKTPADRSGIIIEGDNKWKTLIQNATNSSTSNDV